jgi:hypothetical protein
LRSAVSFLWGSLAPPAGSILSAIGLPASTYWRGLLPPGEPLRHTSEPNGSAVKIPFKINKLPIDGRAER